MIGVTTAQVNDYLGALDRALRDLPRDRRNEVMRDIREHIDAALADDSSPAGVERVLQSLGRPDEIAAAAYAEVPPRKQNMSTRDVATIILLLVGGVVLPMIGWVIGLVCCGRRTPGASATRSSARCSCRADGCCRR